MAISDNIIFLLGVLHAIFGVFIIILHYMRRREMPPEFNWEMDFGGAGVIGALTWFFKKIKEWRKKKRMKKGSGEKSEEEK